MVRSLRRRELPRNRHFALHDSPVGTQARKLHRFLRAIEGDLERSNDVTARIEGGGCLLTMRFAAVRLTRVVSLSAADLQLLAENPKIESILKAAVADS